MTGTNSDTGHYHAYQREDKSRAARVSRALDISFLYHIYYKIKHHGPSVAEPKKIAIRQDFWMAFLFSSIHFVPIAVAFVLIILN